MALPNDSAFPIFEESSVGLTVREYIAALALQGLMANSNPKMIERSSSYAQLAIEAADDLIEKLNDHD